MHSRYWTRTIRARHLLSKASGTILAACLSLSAINSWAADQGVASTVPDASPTAQPLPDFSGIWLRAWTEQQLFDPPESGPGPVTGDPEWPHIRGANSPWIADLTSQILKPETRSRLKELADEQWGGLALLDNDSVCLPLGVLAALNTIDPTQILQTPTQVIFLYVRDHQVRIVDLNRAHIMAGGPTWYGDSVGHYEGDTLVVDTIGMNVKTLVDRYGTPHSSQLHTVERYRFSENDGVLEASVTVEDPIVFTMAWSARFDYRHDPSSSFETSTFEEIVCAENNRPSGDPRMQIPTALNPDF